jgi:hypothetical protein
VRKTVASAQLKWHLPCFIRGTDDLNQPPIRRKKHMIKKILPLGALAIAFAGSAWAQDAASLLNKANQMNYEEIETAKLAHEKAGDNQALLTYADTIKGDHEANEESVSALSRQKSVKLEDGNAPSKRTTSRTNSMRFITVYPNVVAAIWSRRSSP